MGTRNLVAVVKDGEFKVAQYGQWDGYPEGQGQTALQFLRKLKEDGAFDRFCAAVDRCFFYDAAGIKKIESQWRAQMAVLEWNGKGDYDEHRKSVRASYRKEGSLTHMSRDVGADILDIVLTRPDEKLGLIDQRAFGGDSLFCEWAYVIDLDQQSFEVYEGFNKEPTPADSRFPSGADWLEKASQGYEPVKLIQTYWMRALPDDETFVAQCSPSEEDEEEAA